MLQIFNGISRTHSLNIYGECHPTGPKKKLVPPKYGLKPENLNYNSQIFTLTLTSLFLHSTSSSIKHLLCAAAVLFLSDQIHTVGLLLLLLLLLGLLLLDSPLSSSDFYFFVFARLALCPLPSAFFDDCVN